MSKQGFISMHRKIMDHPIWCDANYYKLWSYCLFEASHKDHEILVGNQIVGLKRGQFITGRESLSSDMNKGVKPKQRIDGLTWMRYMKNLEKWEMLNIKTTNKYSIVTVVNYDVYQLPSNEVEQKTEQQLNNKRTTTEQQLNTNNNVNNGNNVKKKDIIVEIVSHLNEHADSKFKPNAKLTVKQIKARIDEGHTLTNFKAVIEYCCKEWKGKMFSNGKMGDEYLKPSTLFNEKFDERLNAALKNKNNTQKKPIVTSENEMNLNNLFD